MNIEPNLYLKRNQRDSMTWELCYPHDDGEWLVYAIIDEHVVAGLLGLSLNKSTIRLKITDLDG